MTATCHGAGCTHLAVSIGNFLRSVYGKSTAIVELNGSNDFARIEETYCSDICSDSKVNTKMFDIHRVDYYKRVNNAELPDIYERYDNLVLDIGTEIEKHREQLLICTDKCLVGCFTPWKIAETMKKVNWLDEVMPQANFKCYVNYGYEEGYKMFKKLPYINPLSPQKSNYPFLMEILEE